MTLNLKPNEQEDLRADLTKPIKKKKKVCVWGGGELKLCQVVMEG